MADQLRRRDGNGEEDEEALSGEVVGDTPQPPREVREYLAMMFQSFDPRPNPLTSKVTEQHIDKLLEIELRREDHGSLQDSEDRRARIHLSYLACAFVLLLTGLLIVAGQQALVQNVVIALISLVAGAFGGYGYRAAAKTTE